MDTDSEYVSVTQLAEILSISASRVRKLVSSGRIIGAFKVGFTWMIRLVQGMPQIIKGRRGPDLTFKNKAPKGKKRIYINRQTVSQNKEKREDKPVICINQSNKKVEHAHEVFIQGSCRIIYNPEKAPCGGATVWIETYSGVTIVNRTPIIVTD